MAKQKFDLGDSLAAVLGNASGPDHSEQITYIDFTKLDEDVENFYSMDGIDELAANIELIGLQQPIRVRANPEAEGRYLIVSGHRRRKAIGELYKDDPEKWGKVACIVEQTAGSPELQELRLIMANADTRRMSSADLAKQVERVQMLLYKLKEDGVIQFSGRMRDAVAEACKISSTKLAQLKVIREKLTPEWKERWEQNVINETVAYKLARLAPEVQSEIDALTTRPDYLTEWRVDEKAENIKKAAEMKCPYYGTACGHAKAMLRVVHLEEGWHRCFSYGCCKKCPDFVNCKFVCPSLRAEQDAERKAKRDRRKEEIAKEKARDQVLVDSARLCWDRFHELRTAAGLSVEDTLTGSGRSYCGKWHDDRYERFENPDEKLTPGADLPFANIHPDDVKAICKTADMLGCSTDYLLGHDDRLFPEPIPTIAHWQIGTPLHYGRYLCLVDLGDGQKMHELKCEFRDFKWTAYGNTLDNLYKVRAWHPLPEEWKTCVVDEE